MALHSAPAHIALHVGHDCTALHGVAANPDAVDYRIAQFSYGDVRGETTVYPGSRVPGE